MLPTRYLLVILWGLGAAAAPLTTARARETESDQHPHYIFTSFRRNGQDGLHLALSRDGFRWKALGGDRSFLTPRVGKAKLMRDPCIVQAPDGTFHMVWTPGWWERSIGYARSPDLVKWSRQELIPVMEHEPTARNAWAPEVFLDSASGKYLILWATTIPGRFAETDDSGDDGLNHRMYFTTTRDFETFAPTRLYFDPGHNVIDATLLEHDSKFFLIYKDETLRPQARKNLKIATSDSAFGPFEGDGEPFTASWVEGPSAIRIGAEVVVYFDRYRAHRYGAVSSRDLETWTVIDERLEFPRDHRHGTVLRISSKVAERLLAVESPSSD